MKSLEESVSLFVEEKIDYYSQWMFEDPIIISEKYNEKLIRLQKIMFKLIRHFVLNYNQYELLMPFDQRVKDILDVCKGQPYKIGTYRTDFVFDDEKQVKLIEITCRFALNGIFLSSLINKVADNWVQENNPSLSHKKQHDGIYHHLKNSYLAGVSNIYILKGKDQRNESKIYTSIFENAGYQCHSVYFEDIEKELPHFENELIISELSFEEILSIPLKTISAMAAMNMINDLRTVFLVHDKRFFSVLGNKEFLKDVLEPNEIDFFDDFYIPSFSYSDTNFNLDDVKFNKNQWIVKHRSLGKSQDVFAGVTMTDQAWANLFERDLTEMTFQKWIPQKTIKGQIGSEEFDDYVTGTLIFFDDHYFGFGDFRTSSFPVTNKVDHRKSASLIVKNEHELPKEKFLNKCI